MKLSFKNGSAEKILIIIEPWAHEYWVGPGELVDVVGEGGVSGGWFEVEYFSEGIIFYGWEGCIVSVFSGGERVF